MAKLRSANEVIDILGGTLQVARQVGLDGSAVAKWRKRNKMPPHYYLQMVQALKRRGHTALPGLWGQAEYLGEVPRPKRGQRLRALA